MQDSESPPEKTSHVSAVNSSKWRHTIIAVVIAIIFAGTSGYLLGSRNNQSTVRLLLSPSPNQTVPTFVQLPISTPSQSTNSHPVATTFNPPASWKTYKSEFGYQYSYPPTWDQSPNVNGRSDGVSVPRATGTIGEENYDGQFIVERRTKTECDLIPENLPQDVTLEKIMISGYPAFKFERWEKDDNNGYFYRKSAFVVHNTACYYVYITSRNNPEQIAILNQILSTFAFTE